jgi:hypothetical protein
MVIEFVLHFTTDGMNNMKCLIGSELFAGYMRVALYRAFIVHSVSSIEQKP